MDTWQEEQIKRMQVSSLALLGSSSHANPLPPFAAGRKRTVPRVHEILRPSNRRV